MFDPKFGDSINIYQMSLEHLVRVDSEEAIETEHHDHKKRLQEPS